MLAHDFNLKGDGSGELLIVSRTLVESTRTEQAAVSLSNTPLEEGLVCSVGRLKCEIVY